MPPATPKLAFAPEGVPTIHPPPVTKPQDGGEAGGAVVTNPQITPIVDEPKTRFTPAIASTTCKALTVILPAPASCSLMITKPPSDRNTIWFAAPVTATAWPLITSESISLCPLVVPPKATQTACALANTKSAAMVVVPNTKPPVVRPTLATAASEDAALPSAITAA